MSEARLRWAVPALALAGIGIAGYLTYVHYAETESICLGGGGACERVQSSEYAELAGIPVALIGLLGYIAVGAVSLRRSEPALLAAAAMALAGAGFALYLTYLELFVIDAICQWCVANAVVVCLLAAAATARLLRAGAAP